MEIGILGLASANGETLREVSRIREEIELAGHTPRFYNYRQSALVINNEGRVLHGYDDEGRNLIPINPEVVIPRIGRFFDEGCFAVRALAMQGVPSTATEQGIRNAKNKDYTALLLDAAGIPSPYQVIPNGRLPEKTDILLKPIENPTTHRKRFVIKAASGASHGNGVMLGESRTSARSILEGNARRRLVVQEFVEPPEHEDGYSDIRLIVLQNKVLAGMKRTTSSKEEEREFRTNLSLGAEGEAYVPTQREEEIAVKAAAAVGLEFAGIDIMHSIRGPLVIETNANPEFGIEEVTGTNIAEKLVALAISKVVSIDKS